MKKTLLIILAVIGIIIFFYPKQKYFGCGAICTQENAQRIKDQEANTVCIGIGFKPHNVVMDADVRGCYGIFIET